jgi:type IV pilus assembly protein PilC
MSHFIYKAKKSNGETYKGEQDAADRYELYKILKEKGEEVVDVREGKSMNLKTLSISLPFLHSIKAQEKITFARNLGSMITAGLSMTRALAVMERQTRNKEMIKILAALQTGVGEGKTLSEAMSNYKNVFSPIFVSMVAAGEQSGTLAESLRIVAVQMDKTYALQRRIKGAMMYPGIILFAMILIAILLLTYIVPTLMKTFTEMKLDLPMSTKFVLWCSSTVRDHGLIVLFVAMIVAGLCLKSGLSMTIGFFFIESSCFG